jgi:hypothetical protein
VADLIEKEPHRRVLEQLSFSSEATVERSHAGPEEEEGDAISMTFSGEGHGFLLRQPAILEPCDNFSPHLVMRLVHVRLVPCKPRMHSALNCLIEFSLEYNFWIIVPE